MIKINVITSNVNWLKYIKNPKKYFDQKIKKLNLKNDKYIKTDFFLTILLSGSKEIKSLNNKFRNKNKETDVLSFPFYSKKDLNDNLKKEKEVYLGDIIINLSKIYNKKNNKKFKLEFDKLWIHGLLHLFGYDHIKNKDFAKMSYIEKKIFPFNK